MSLHVIIDNDKYLLRPIKGKWGCKGEKGWFISCVYLYQKQPLKTIAFISAGIKKGGNTALVVLFVLFGISSLICFLHSPSKVLCK